MKDYKVAIGERLNTILTERNVTQKELAEAIGVKPNVISYFCSGIRTPNSEQITKIAEFLNVSVDYLLCQTDIMSTDTTIQNICEYTGLSEKTVELLHKSKNSIFYNVLPVLNFIVESDSENILNNSGNSVVVYRPEESIHLRLLEKIVSYFKTSLSRDEKCFYIQKSGRIFTSDDNIFDTQITGDNWDDKITVSTVDSSDIIDKVLLDDILREFKSAKSLYKNKCELE